MAPRRALAEPKGLLFVVARTLPVAALLLAVSVCVAAAEPGSQWGWTKGTTSASARSSVTT